MRHLLIAKTFVELQGMTRRAILRKRDGRHVALSYREGHGFSRAATRRQRRGLQPLGYAVAHLGRIKGRRVRPSVISLRRAMAIIATHLHPRVIWPHEMRLQMDIVIELHLSRIRFARAQRRKLRMALGKRCNGSHIVGPSITRLQIGMALRTTGVRSRCEQSRSLVLQMTRTARGRESLVGMVRGCVMACQASLVAHLRAEACRRGRGGKDCTAV